MSTAPTADPAEADELETPAVYVQRYRNTRTNKRTWVASWDCQCGKTYSTGHHDTEQASVDQATSVLIEHDLNFCPLQGGIALCDEPEPAE